MTTEAPAAPLRKWEALPPKVRVGLFRFPFDMREMSTTVDWLLRSSHYLNNHERVEIVASESIADTPVDMSRNRALKRAKELGLHFAIFIDSDMWPDYEYIHNQCKETDAAKEFLPNAFEFALQHDGPCVIGVPYCCAPPEERVLVMKWVVQETDAPPGASHIKSYDREEVDSLRGFGEVAALGTGLLLIDLRALDVLPEPYFTYEFKDAAQTEKASTEDIVFTRDLHLLDVPQYCFWSSWAGHWKNKLVVRPATIPLAKVSKAMRTVLWKEFDAQFVRQYGPRLQRLAELEQRFKEMEGAKPLTP